MLVVGSNCVQKVLVMHWSIVQFVLGAALILEDSNSFLLVVTIKNRALLNEVQF
jgi:hypothetical protein